MATATVTRNPEAATEQRLVFNEVEWGQYVAISDALPERRNARLIFSDGRLTFVTKSIFHEWFADCLGTFVLLVASGCGLECDSVGSTTFRRKSAGSGAEGDKTFYFGANAGRMRGRRNVDLSVDPPPDLAIEVEVTHSAEDAMLTWGRLGVPEVWRFDAERRALSIWKRRKDGTYQRTRRSRYLPMIESAEVVEQLGTAEVVGMSRWTAGLVAWVRDVLVPRGR
jgi:Uma2 family endonuclease